MKNIIINLSVIIALSALITGCESSGGTGGDPGTDYNYTLDGFFVQDVNLSAQKLDYNDFSAAMTRNTENLTTAQLFLGTTALVYNISDSQYSFENSPRAYKNSGTQTINIVDSTFFADTLSFEVHDSLWITNYPDSTIPNTNGTSMFVEWSGVFDVEGYAVGVVLAGSEYTGAGFSAYVTEQGTSTLIPPDAFRANLTQTLDTGWYNFYVYGYSGSPDSVLSAEVLPVPFPSQLADNVTHTNMIGHFGSIVVSRKKMIHVVSN